jgi:hypothetical protein
VWALHGAVGAAIAVTHSRTPPERLYNTRGGGLSRAGVFAAYPTAVTALGMLPAARRRELAPAAALLCATVAVPGVIDERELDLNRRHLPAIAGVALTALAQPRPGDGPPPRSRLRRPLAVMLVAGSTPWLLALAGRQTRGMREPTPGEPGVDRVHLGHHEGLDGCVLALDALLLSRRGTGPLQRWLLALTLTYGCAVAIQDGWYEQVVKRGWARRRPQALGPPGLSRGWAAVMAGTVVAQRLLLR